MSSVQLRRIAALVGPRQMFTECSRRANQRRVGDLVQPYWEPSAMRRPRCRLHPCLWREECASGPQEGPNLEDARTRPQRHPAPVRVALQAPVAPTSFAAPLGCFTAARHITHTSILFRPRDLVTHHEPTHTETNNSPKLLVVADLTSIDSMCPCDQCRVPFICLRSGSCFSCCCSSSSCLSL